MNYRDPSGNEVCLVDDTVDDGIYYDADNAISRLEVKEVEEWLEFVYDVQFSVDHEGCIIPSSLQGATGSFDRDEFRRLVRDRRNRVNVGFWGIDEPRARGPGGFPSSGIKPVTFLPRGGMYYEIRIWRGVERAFQAGTHCSVKATFAQDNGAKFAHELGHAYTMLYRPRGTSTAFDGEALAYENAYYSRKGSSDEREGCWNHR